jgi:DNA-binding response OmpR family regulator
MKRVFTPVKRKTILIIDDDQVALHIYREKFQRHGFKVEVAESANSVWQTIRRESTALLILDLCLPQLNGVELVKDIRAVFDMQTAPIIAFSNPYLGSLERAALEAGANQSVAKAETTPDQLLELARELLGGSASTEMAVSSETQFEEKLIAAVLAKAPDTLAKLRTSHQLFVKSEPESARQSELSEMHRQLRALTGSIGLFGFHKIAQMAVALEALLIGLQAKPEKISPSVVRTIAQAIDTLASLFDEASPSQAEILAPPKIAIVDDEIISRETISAALGKANLGATSLDDPLAAQRLFAQERFDLIFLDVEMPGMTGLQLCVKIREMATNSTTPVVFVTSHSDFGSRAQSTLSGGNDFIAKPFLLVELALKALTWLFKKAPPPSAATIPPKIAPAEAGAGQPLADHAAFSIHEQ